MEENARFTFWITLWRPPTDPDFAPPERGVLRRETMWGYLEQQLAESSVEADWPRNRPFSEFRRLLPYELVANFPIQ